MVEVMNEDRIAKRVYTVEDIDRLRIVHEDKIIWGRYSGPSGRFGNSRSYNAEEVSKKVEDRVRTSMLAGHTAKDLLESEE